MRIPTPLRKLFGAFLCLYGTSASATIVDLTFEGQFTHTYDSLFEDSDGVSDSVHQTDSGPATLRVTVEVTDSDLVHTRTGAGDNWTFEGTILSLDLSGLPPVETDSLRDEWTEGLGRISENSLTHFVEGSHSVSDSGFSLTEGSLALDAYVLGFQSGGVPWRWDSAGISFFLQGISDSSGLNSFQGYFAQNFATYSDFSTPPPPEFIPGYYSMLEISETWNLDLALAHVAVRPVIPEPASAVLLGLGVLVPLLRRLRTR